MKWLVVGTWLVAMGIMGYGILQYWANESVVYKHPSLLMVFMIPLFLWAVWAPCMGNPLYDPFSRK